MIKILIIDDNTNDVANLKKRICKFFTNKQIAYDIYIINKLDLSIDFNEYDLIYLDVEVDGVNSINFSIKERLDTLKNKLIITSKYKKYLIDGYKIHAERFFLKPISQKSFDIEMENVVNNYHWDSITIYEPELVNRRVYLKNILYIEHFERKSIVYLINGVSLKSTFPLKYWEEKLHNCGFAMSHRSFLVNLRNISGFNRDEIIMINDHKIPISRNCKKDFMNSYLAIMQEVV